MRLVIYSKVDKVFEMPSVGWFIHLEGSHESLFVGEEKPDFNVADEVKITIERTKHEAPTD